MSASEKIIELVARFPTPGRDGKLSEVDKQATDQAVAELLRGGRQTVIALVGMLTVSEKGGDSRVRHALHALVTHVAGMRDDKQRREIAEALASTLGSDRPKEVQGFVVRQLQLIGGKVVVEALGKLLLDEALSEPSVQALLAIKEGSVEQFRSALPRSAGKQRLAIVQALGVLRDAQSADELKKIAADKDRELGLAAIWALANMGDAGSADLVLKAADSAGYERTKATQACLLLAEKLLAGGHNKEAAQIYSRLRDSRTEPAEAYVREAAARGLEKTR
jgi:HEAT repeat protein